MAVRGNERTPFMPPNKLVVTITTALVTTLSPVSEATVCYIDSSNALNINYRIWNMNKGWKHSLAPKYSQCSSFG